MAQNNEQFGNGTTAQGEARRVAARLRAGLRRYLAALLRGLAVWAM